MYIFTRSSRVEFKSTTSGVRVQDLPVVFGDWEGSDDFAWVAVVAGFKAEVALEKELIT